MSPPLSCVVLLFGLLARFPLGKLPLPFFALKKGLNFREQNTGEGFYLVVRNTCAVVVDFLLARHGITSKLFLVEQIALKHRPIPGDEPTTRILGNLLGGVLSGGLNFASMMPMANRLQAALDSAAFGYTEEDLAKDIIEIAHITVDDRETDKAAAPAKEIVDDPATGGKKTHKITSLFAKKAPNAEEKADEDVFKTLNKLSKLKERGIIAEEEFNSKKKELLSHL